MLDHGTITAILWGFIAVNGFCLVALFFTPEFKEFVKDLKEIKKKAEKQ